ncbi:MAG: gluconokinase, partial [Gemmatimonadaceae bacterium]
MKTGLFIVMGVAGAGKSIVGSALARALGVDFVEGDDYHPAENRRRMSAGIPLTDKDRFEWLRLLATRLREAKDAGRGVVLACSALKRSYRDVLRVETPNVRFVYLEGQRAVLAERLAERRGHFMPSSLLDSQLAALQEPAPDEQAWFCDIRDAPEDIVAALV